MSVGSVDPVQRGRVGVYRSGAVLEWFETSSQRRSTSPDASRWSTRSSRGDWALVLTDPTIPASEGRRLRLVVRLFGR